MAMIAWDRSATAVRHSFLKRMSRMVLTTGALGAALVPSTLIISPCWAGRDAPPRASTDAFGAGCPDIPPAPAGSVTATGPALATVLGRNADSTTIDGQTILCRPDAPWGIGTNGPGLTRVTRVIWGKAPARSPGTLGLAAVSSDRNLWRGPPQRST